MMNIQSAPYLHDRWDDEVALEEEMLALGKAKAKERIDKARKRGDMSGLRPQRSLIHEWVLPVADKIESWINAASAKRGVKSIALPLLKLLPPDVSAVCALRVIMRQLGHETPGIIAISFELGTWIEHEARARAWQQGDEEHWKAMSAHYSKRGSNAAHQKRSRIAIFNKFVAEKIGWVNWTDEQRRRVGLELIGCVVSETKRFHIVPDPKFNPNNHRKGKANRRQLVLQADADLMTWLDGAMDDELVHSATFLPTIIPPKPWVSYFEYTMEWLMENDPKHIAIQEAEAFTYVGYMVKKLWEAVGAKVDRARDVMRWLQENCDLACKDGKPLFWKTPSSPWPPTARV